MVKYNKINKKGELKMNAYEVRKEAREVLKGKWAKGVGIVLAYILISFILGLLSGIFEENTILALFFSIVEIMMTVPLSFGLEFVFLKLKRNENVRAFEFIKIGSDNFSRCWKIAVRTILKLILPIIVFLGSIFAFCGMIIYSVMQSAVGGTENLGTSIIIGVIIYLIAIIYYVSVSLLYSLTSYIAYDNKEMTASEIVEQSAKLMRGNRWKIVLLELSFIGWAILATFTLGIGYLWLIPYMRIAVVCFYDRLVKSREIKTSVDDIESDEPIQEM